MSKEPKHNKATNPLNQYARYSGIAMQMMAIMAISAWAGVKLDAFLNLRFPLFTLIFIISSVGLVLFKIVRAFSK